MSIRSELRPYQVLTDSLITADKTSLVTIIQKISLVSYTYSWTGTSPVGTLKVEVSNDYSIDAQGNVSNAGHWSSVAFLAGTATALTVAVSGNTGSTNIVLPLCGAYAVRTVYTFSSGTGILQAWICGKVS